MTRRSGYLGCLNEYGLKVARTAARGNAIRLSRAREEKREETIKKNEERCVELNVETGWFSRLAAESGGAAYPIRTDGIVFVF